MSERTKEPLVLIVEDVDYQRRLFELISEPLGIKAHIVENAEQALQALDLIKFDLILVDWILPGMDGIALSYAIREKLKQADAPVPPIICVTAKAFDTDREHVLRSGLDDYISKPFSIEELKAVMNKWLHSEFRINVIRMQPKMPPVVEN